MPALKIALSALCPSASREVGMMDGRSTIVAWGLGGTAAFTLMHVADELWSRWDIGETQVSSSFEAGLVAAGPVVVALIAMAGVALKHGWGFWLSLGVGAFALWPPLTHLIDTNEMTAYRWSVEILAIASAVTVIAAAASELMALRATHRPSGRSVFGH
jgi:hypothetical protein